MHYMKNIVPKSINSFSKNMPHILIGKYFVYFISSLITFEKREKEPGKR